MGLLEIYTIGMLITLAIMCWSVSVCKNKNFDEWGQLIEQGTSAGYRILLFSCIIWPVFWIGLVYELFIEKESDG